METQEAKEEYKYVRKQDNAKKSQFRIKAMLGEEVKGKSLLDKESQMLTIWNEYLSLELKSCLKGEEAGVYDSMMLNEFKVWLDEMLTTGKTKGIQHKVWREGRTFLDFERTVLEQWQKVINEEADKLREHNSNAENFRITEENIVSDAHQTRDLLLRTMKENHDSLVQLLQPSVPGTVAEQQAQLKINIAQNREIKKVMNGMKKKLLVGHTCTFEETEYVVEDVLEGTGGVKTYGLVKAADLKEYNETKASKGKGKGKSIPKPDVIHVSENDFTSDYTLEEKFIEGTIVKVTSEVNPDDMDAKYRIGFIGQVSDTPKKADSATVKVTFYCCSNVEGEEAESMTVDVLRGHLKVHDSDPAKADGETADGEAADGEAADGEVVSEEKPNPHPNKWVTNTMYVLRSHEDSSPKQKKYAGLIGYMVGSTTKGKTSTVSFRVECEKESSAPIPEEDGSEKDELDVDSEYIEIKVADFSAESMMKNFQIAPDESSSINPPVSNEKKESKVKKAGTKRSRSDESEDPHLVEAGAFIKMKKITAKMPELNEHMMLSNQTVKIVESNEADVVVEYCLKDKATGTGETKQLSLPREAFMKAIQETVDCEELPMIDVPKAKKGRSSPTYATLDLSSRLQEGRGGTNIFRLLHGATGKVTKEDDASVSLSLSFVSHNRVDAPPDVYKLNGIPKNYVTNAEGAEDHVNPKFDMRVKIEKNSTIGNAKARGKGKVFKHGDEGFVCALMNKCSTDGPRKGFPQGIIFRSNVSGKEDVPLKFDDDNGAFKFLTPLVSLPSAASSGMQVGSASIVGEPSLPAGLDEIDAADDSSSSEDESKKRSLSDMNGGTVPLKERPEKKMRILSSTEVAEMEKSKEYTLGDFVTEKGSTDRNAVWQLAAEGADKGTWYVYKLTRGRTEMSKKAYHEDQFELRSSELWMNTKIAPGGIHMRYGPRRVQCIQMCEEMINKLCMDIEDGEVLRGALSGMLIRGESWTPEVLFPGESNSWKETSVVGSVAPSMDDMPPVKDGVLTLLILYPSMENKMHAAITNLLMVNEAFTNSEVFSMDKNREIFGLMSTGKSETHPLPWRLMSKSAMILKNWSAFVDNDEKCTAKSKDYDSINWPEVNLCRLRPHKIIEFLTFIRIACDVRNKHTNLLKSSATMQPMMKTYVESLPENWLPVQMRKTYLLYVKPYYTGEFVCAPEEYGIKADARPESPKDVIRCFIHSFIYNPDKIFLNNDAPWVEKKTKSTIAV